MTENIWTHSGIQQGTETHNVLRFERGAPNGQVVRQREPSTSRMTVTPGTEGALVVDADLSAAYGDNSPVQRWTRKLDFTGTRLRVEDDYRLAQDTKAVFQLNLPVEPKIDGQTATAGGLRVRVIAPTGALLSKLEWRSIDSGEYRSGWRLDISGGTGTYVVELEDTSN